MSEDTSALLEYERIVEAIVFASPAPVSDERLAEALPDGVDLQSVLDALVAFYRDRGATFERNQFGLWRFNTAPVLAQLPPLLDQRPNTYSPATLQVLAAIVWRQPVSIASIDLHRGVKTSPSIIKRLVNDGWIEPGLRLQEPGEPIGWVTTDAFLTFFGLAGLDDLPDPDELDRLLDRPEEDLEKTRLGLSAMPIGQGTE